MKSFLQDMMMNLARWMQGRYGNDSLSNGLVALGIIALLLSIIPGLDALSLLSFACLAIAIFRSLSKNFARRRKENDAYERVMKGPKRTYAIAKKAWAYRTTTRYFKCKGCGTALSVPRGKGTLRVVRPKCKKETTRKS
jgi:uncharacterized membrane protein YbaN (DUF454 family)